MKKCPFCGSDGTVTISHYPMKIKRKGSKDIPENAKIVKEVERGNRTMVYFYPVGYYAQCSNKSCIGRNHKMYQTKEKAVEEWNKRV